MSLTWVSGRDKIGAAGGWDVGCDVEAGAMGKVVVPAREVAMKAGAASSAEAGKTAVGTINTEGAVAAGVSRAIVLPPAGRAVVETEAGAGAGAVEGSIVIDKVVVWRVNKLLGRGDRLVWRVEVEVVGWLISHN